MWWPQKEDLILLSSNQTKLKIEKLFIQALLKNNKFHTTPDVKCEAEAFPSISDDAPNIHEAKELRDHPFKTSAICRGQGSKIGQICRRIVVKNC